MPERAPHAPGRSRPAETPAPAGPAPGAPPEAPASRPMAGPPPRLVSVLMPAHDVAPFVAEAVRSALAQGWPSVELIAVDDGSRDGTGALLDALAQEWGGEGRRMVVHHQPQRGAAAARNAALDLARGEALAFLDADDRWHPGLLGRLMATLDADPALDLVFPRWRYVDAEGRPIGMVSRGPSRPLGAADLMADNPIHSATGVVLRRRAALRAGRFDEALKACIDLDYWVRVASGRPGALGCVAEILADYRKRPGQITADWRRMAGAWARVADKMEAAGHGLSPRERARARARNGPFWSAVAYEAGDYAAARRLILETWRRDPGFALGDPAARLRSLAGLAALLPAPLHAALRARAARRASG